MLEITAKVLDNKNITLSNKNFGNKYDNSVRKVIFSEICENGNLLNKYAAFLSPSNEIFLFPLKSEDNSFIISTNITKEAGAWKLIYLATNKEIINGVIDENYKVFVSNSIDFTITENFLNDTIEEPIIDPNLNIIYEQLEQTIIYLNSQDFINELLQNFELTEQNINQITTTLKNDETFKQEIKGDKGDKGDKGEQGPQGEQGPIGPSGSNGADGFSPIVSSTKIVNGNKLIIQDSTHTEEIDILNGEKGEPGEDGIGIYQEWINNNKYDVGLVDGSKPFYWNKNILETILSQSPFYDQQIVLKTDATVLKYIHNDRVFNVYNANDLNNRVGWITLSEEIQKEKESSYFTLNTSTEFISVLDALFLKVPFLYITEYTETYMKGPKGDSFKYEDFTPEQLEALKGPKGDKGESAFDIWKSNTPSAIAFFDENTLFSVSSDYEKLFYFSSISETLQNDEFNFAIVFCDTDGNEIDTSKACIVLKRYNEYKPDGFTIKTFSTSENSYISSPSSFNFYNRDSTFTLKEICTGTPFMSSNFTLDSSWKYFKIKYSGTFSSPSFTLSGIQTVRTFKESSELTEDDFLESLKGDNGADGFSPTITKSSITNGTRLTITDKTQTQTVDITNGTNYTITSSDYDAIADVVLTKMTNADNVSY